MKVIILGSFSDIGRALIKFLQEDGHRVYGWHRGEELLIPMEPAWDLIICAIGALGSIGKWEDADDVKWYALAPGIVLTKIHKPTIDTRWINERLSEAMNVGGTPMAKIYECLRWCMEAQKATIGGRNICVS